MTAARESSRRPRRAPDGAARARATRSRCPPAAAACSWGSVLEDLQLLRGERLPLDAGQASDISAGPGKAPDDLSHREPAFDVMSLDVAVLAEAQRDSAPNRGLGVHRERAEIPDSPHLPRLLPVGSKRRSEETDAQERSEERRVGRECRSRWTPYHEKKK